MTAQVRKHRAPKGALRHRIRDAHLCIATDNVRKHRAPNGALRRLDNRAARVQSPAGQKAPSAKRCIKTARIASWPNIFLSQKAPSAKRCIKTFPGNQRATHMDPPVRKHRAPKGALRPKISDLPLAMVVAHVRKHRAPKGALRLRLTRITTIRVHERARKH